MSPNERLSHAVSSRGWTLAEAARRAGISRAMCSRLANHEDAWDTTGALTVARLEQALELPPGYLRTGDTPENPEEMNPLPGDKTPTTLPLPPRAGNYAAPAPTPQAQPDIDALTARVMARIREQEAPPAIDLARPISETAGQPRPVHQSEDWGDQGRCLLDAVRSAYIDWLNQPDETQDADSLVELVAVAANDWAGLHAAPENGQGHGMSQKVRPDSAVFTDRGEPTTPQALELTAPLVTLQARVQTADENGKKVIADKVKDRNGDIVFIPCRHVTSSEDKADHPFVLWGKESRSREDRNEGSRSLLDDILGRRR